MKIAVTGGSGFVGQWLLRRLKDEHDFVVIGRKIGKKKLEVKGKQFRYIETNYLKKDLSKKLRNIDAVVHLAATRVGSNSIVDYMSNITNNRVEYISHSLTTYFKHVLSIRYRFYFRRFPIFCNNFMCFFIFFCFFE